MTGLQQTSAGQQGRTDQQRTGKAYLVGTHRMVSPTETLGRVRPLMPAMGITRIANVTGLDRIGIPVVMVCRPNSRSIAVSQGKGLDLDAAKASGLMEAVEIYHAERIDLPLKLGSYKDLAGKHRVVDVESLPHVAGDRYRPDLAMLWIEGVNLLDDRPIWLPYETVHANFTLPYPPGSGCFPASTNGLASGNHPVEAVVHGICEVIERDATTLWNHLSVAARRRRRIDLETVEDATCREVLERLEQAQMAVAVWETTSDIGIPSFYSLIVDQRRDEGHLGAGAGCHPNKTVALLRAVTEAVQVRNTYITGSRDDLTAAEYTAAGLSDKLRGASAMMAGNAPSRDFRRIVGQDARCFEDDVEWLLERLRAVGVGQVVLVDLTKPEFRIPVVRIVIPGLEGPDDDDDYVPGQRVSALREAPT